MNVSHFQNSMSDIEHVSYLGNALLWLISAVIGIALYALVGGAPEAYGSLCVCVCHSVCYQHSVRYQHSVSLAKTKC